MVNQTRQEAVNEIRKAHRKSDNSEKFIVVEKLTAFTGFAPTTLDCSVDCNGVVRVYDGTAKQMTSCHSISEADQARIRDAVASGKSII